MPSEITAFIQAQPQTQTQINPNTNTQSDQENLQPGLFDSFMSEYALPEEIITDITQSQSLKLTQDETQLIAFTGSKTFSQSVIDILAGLNENKELQQEIPEKIEDIIDTLKDTGEKIHDDVKSIIAKVKAVVSEKISELEAELPDDINGLVSQVLNDESIPEETRNEIVKVIDELVNELKDSEFAGENVKNFALKLSDMIHEHGRSEKVFASVDEHDLNDTEDIDDDNNTELKDTHGNIPGYAVIQNADTKPADTVNESETESESHTELTQTNHALHDVTRGHAENQHTQNVSHESKHTAQKADAKVHTGNESESENVNHESNFDSHLEVSENENAKSNQNHEQKNQSNNPSGHEEDNSHEQSQNHESGTRITSRTRNDTRRASADTSRTDDDRTDTNSRRTESRNNFQSFFEGVLSTRRNASRTSPLPLNLNTASYNFTQSSTLRDGLVNVVRFIRADGVQKANVVIDPPALGRISVELTSGTSGVEASIKVASEQIRQLVQDQLSELRMNLSQQGVQVAEFTVDVQQDNSNGSHQNNRDDGNTYRTFALNESDDDITEEFRVDLEEGLLYWVA
ncbi:MAG: flagellar hook-length control protein FliK [Synergistaceae bacterium]|nr:flagellar hook-length control protein FliK [Synergistaceae bacterium]